MKDQVQNNQHQTLGFFGSEPKADITVPLVPVALVVNADCWARPGGFTIPNWAAAKPTWSHFDLRFFSSFSEPGLLPPLRFTVPTTNST